MHIKKLKNIQETLATAAEEQLEHLECVDAKELGEVIDIIKDIEETIYYCTITKAMKGEAEHEKENVMYYMPIHYEEKCAKTHPAASIHDIHTSKMMHHTENEHSHISEDEREGKSHRFRRMYIEAKETKQDKTAQMKELEKYAQELTSDIVEMIQDASSEEKQYLSKKIAALSNKIAQA